MEDIQENKGILESRSNETQHKKVKKKNGRPELIDLERLTKLEQAFAIDSTVKEACSYAEVSQKVFYDYLKRHSEFSERIDDLRQRPILKARQTIVKGLDESKNAQWYLERKRKNEFAERQELTGSDGKEIRISGINYIIPANGDNPQTNMETTPSVPSP